MAQALYHVQRPVAYSDVQRDEQERLTTNLIKCQHTQQNLTKHMIEIFPLAVLTILITHVSSGEKNGLFILQGREKKSFGWVCIWCLVALLAVLVVLSSNTFLIALTNSA